MRRTVALLIAVLCFAALASAEYQAWTDASFTDATCNTSLTSQCGLVNPVNDTSGSIQWVGPGNQTSTLTTSGRNDASNPFTTTNNGQHTLLATIIWSNNDNLSGSLLTATWNVNIHMVDPAGGEGKVTDLLKVTVAQGDGTDQMVLTLQPAGSDFDLGNSLSLGNLQYYVGSTKLTPQANGDVDWATSKGHSSTLSLYADIAAVPEPGAILLFGTLVVGLAAFTAKRRSKA